MRGDGEIKKRVTKSKHETSKTLVVQVKDHVPITRVSSSFNSVLPLRSVKIAKAVVGQSTNCEDR